MLLFLAAELSSGPREGRGMVHHRHMAEGNLVRPKVTGGQSNLLASGWFIIPWGDVALLGPNREGVKVRTVSVAVVKGCIENQFSKFGIKGRGPWKQSPMDCGAA